MVWKLAWEIRNLEREEASITGPFQRDKEAEFAAFNCSIAAWHTLDWIWRASSQKKKKQISSTGSFKDFKAEMATECRSLLICQNLCNSSKHASPGGNLSLRCIGQFFVHDVSSRDMSFSLIIEVEEKELAAVSVFKEAGVFLFNKILQWDLFEVLNEDDRLFE